MMKTAHVFEYNGNLYFRPYSQTTAGVWIGTDSIMRLDTAAPNSEIGRVVLLVIDKSQYAIPHPSVWSEMDDDPLLKAAGVKSWSAFMKKAKCLAVDLENLTLRLIPRRNMGPREGYEPMPEQSVEIPLDSPPQHIGLAIRDKLSSCC
jgi:hypothetical protein